MFNSYHKTHILKSWVFYDFWSYFFLTSVQTMLLLASNNSFESFKLSVSEYWGILMHGRCVLCLCAWYNPCTCSLNTPSLHFLWFSLELKSMALPVLKLVQPTVERAADAGDLLAPLPVLQLLYQQVVHQQVRLVHDLCHLTEGFLKPEAGKETHRTTLRLRFCWQTILTWEMKAWWELAKHWIKTSSYLV